MEEDRASGACASSPCPPVDIAVHLAVVSYQTHLKQIDGNAAKNHGLFDETVSKLTRDSQDRPVAANLFVWFGNLQNLRYEFAVV